MPEINNFSYIDEGKGYPLVLVHGFLGNAEMWRPQIDEFKKYFRVIAPDLPGYGKNNKYKLINSIEGFASEIFNFLQNLKIEKFNLVGHSMGGMIVQQMSVNFSSHINKLICYSTGSIGEMPNRFETIDESRKKIKTNGLEITSLNIAKTWFVNGENDPNFYLCKNASSETTLDAADASLVAMKSWNGKNNLYKINNKTLIIWGDLDKSYDKNQIDILHSNIKNSELKIVNGFAHNVHLENPKIFNKLLLDFLI